MKTVAITRTDRLTNFDFEKTSSIVQACTFLLTQLATEDSGAIFAKWDLAANCAIWKQTKERAFVFEPPREAIEILRIADISVFRSMLSRIGFLLVDDGYMGAGTFEISFDKETPQNRTFAIFFSNMRSTGYWAKLQVVEGSGEIESKPGNPTSGSQLVEG